jgi:hypothetical protein
MKETRSRARRKLRPTEWENLGNGVMALKLWKSKGPKWPQVAILLLPSSAEYAAFLKNPTDYVNGLKVFAPKETKKVVGCRFARKKAGTSYVVILKHEMDCTSTGMSSSNVVTGIRF